MKSTLLALALHASCEIAVSCVGVRSSFAADALAAGGIPTGVTSRAKLDVSGTTPSLAVARDLGAGQPQLAVARARVDAADRLESLLTAHGVVADGESLAVLYAMNPGLTAKRAASMDIAVPEARSANGAPCGNCVLLLTWGAPQKAELHASVTRLNALVRGAHVAEGDHRALDLCRDAAQQLERLDRIVSDRDFPVPSAMVAAGSAQARLLLTSTEAWLAGRGARTDSVASLADAVAADMRARLRSFDEPKVLGQTHERWIDVTVSVNTVQGPDKKVVQGLSVFLAPEALYGVPDQTQPFDRLSSPTDCVIGEANYLIWAERPGTKGAVTEIKRVLVRKHDGPQVVDLTVK